MEEKRKLTEANENLELESRRKLDAEREKIREDAQKKADEENRFKIADKEKVITDLQVRLQDLQRKAEQGSMQPQGEVLELDFEQQLRQAFPLEALLEKLGKRRVKSDFQLVEFDGLQRFRDLGATGTRAVVFDIAMLGRNGLVIQDPGKQYSLYSLPGTSSSLQLMSLMYTGMQIIDPTADPGIDWSNLRIEPASDDDSFQKITRSPITFLGRAEMQRTP